MQSRKWGTNKEKTDEIEKRKSESERRGRVEKDKGEIVRKGFLLF